MDKTFFRLVPKGWVIAGSVAAGVVILIVLLAFFGDTTAVSRQSNRDLALSCTTDMATRYHVHTRLSIVMNGEKQAIPEGIGVRPTCMNPLHIHGDDGTIHVESPEKRDFTLSDFFAVWGKPFSRNQILEAVADETHVIRVTVNGQEVEGYENTVLGDDEEIVISYEEKK